MRKEFEEKEEQCNVLISISNNIGYVNSLRDTLFRNNITENLISYLKWQRTGTLCELVRNNYDITEDLECPQQYWLVSRDELSSERFDAFFIAQICIILMQE